MHYTDIRYDDVLASITAYIPAYPARYTIRYLLLLLLYICYMSRYTWYNNTITLYTHIIP